MTTPTVQDYSLTTFEYVVVEKEKLLSKLRENREDHNSIYDAAVSGYWVEAQRILNEKKSEFDVAVSKTTAAFIESFEERSLAVSEKNLKGVGGFSAYLGFSSSWPLSFPTNHLEDYDRVISMMEFSVADKVQLKSADFDSYVRNNWSWTKDFGASNQGYVQCITGAALGGYLIGASGMSPSLNLISGFAAQGSSYLTNR